MDVGTFKHAGKEPTVSSDPSSSDTPSDDANGGGGEDSDVLRVREGGTEHGDEEDEVTGGGAHKRRRVDDDGGELAIKERTEVHAMRCVRREHCAPLAAPNTPRRMPNAPDSANNLCEQSPSCLRAH